MVATYAHLALYVVGEALRREVHSLRQRYKYKQAGKVFAWYTSHETEKICFLRDLQLHKRRLALLHPGWVAR